MFGRCLENWRENKTYSFVLNCLKWIRGIRYYQITYLRHFSPINLGRLEMMSQIENNHPSDFEPTIIKK